MKKVLISLFAMVFLLVSAPVFADDIELAKKSTIESILQSKQLRVGFESGFSVFSHSETPGLGGEIESAWFQKNFKGKKIVNAQNKFVSVGIAKGKAENLPKDKQANYVDGISGATLTGRFLSEGIKQTLIQYDSVSINFRQGQLKTSKNDHSIPADNRNKDQ